uniref:troponin T, cardiac muscle-like n=1 Tax=Styela clava TaxID=7725 RepID=UPI001939BEAE|nr:troponin T, cardiac muscle-like [Styela clava]
MSESEEEYSTEDESEESGTENEKNEESGTEDEKNEDSGTEEEKEENNSKKHNGHEDEENPRNGDVSTEPSNKSTNDQNSGYRTDKENNVEKTENKVVTPILVPPEIHPGEQSLQLESIYKKRMDKDMTELQTLINSHFEARKKEEEDLELLRIRIEKRKAEREEQMKIRMEIEKERQTREKEERKKREEEEDQKRQEDEVRKKAAIGMSLHYGGYLARAEKNKPNKRQTEREKKKKFLADRRKPLNIDHLSTEKTQEKARELWNWLYKLEEEKYDFEQRIQRQKYDISHLRHRVNEYMGKFSSTKRQMTAMGPRSGIAAKSSVFK